MAKSTRKAKKPQRNSKVVSAPKMTSGPHQARPTPRGAKVTQYLVESRVQRPKSGILRKQAKLPASSNLFPGTDERGSGRWLWILWILPIGAVVAYFAAHMGAAMIEGEWVRTNGTPHRVFCTALDIGITYGAKFDDEAKRAACP